MPSTPRIASNLLWRGEGVLRNPLVTLDAAGRIFSVETCAEPDRMPYTEFWSGILVADFPADYVTVFAQMQTHPDTPLPDLLKTLTPATPGVLVVISGLDYDTLRLNSRSQIRKLSTQIGR